MTFTTPLTTSPPNIPSAISEFTQPLTPLLSSPSKSSQLEESLSSSWRSLLKLVASTPHENNGQKDIIDFILQLRKQRIPDLDVEVKIWDEKFEWINLPLFGPGVREWWDITEPDPFSKSVKEEDKQKWINQNAFLAQLTSNSVSKGDALDFALYGIWALRAAFEEEVDVEVGKWVQEAARVWVLYAGKVLKERSLKGETWEGKIARGGARFENNGWRGLNKERWGVWVEGLKGSDAGREALGVIGESI